MMAWRVMALIDDPIRQVKSENGLIGPLWAKFGINLTGVRHGEVTSTCEVTSGFMYAKL